MKKTNRKLPDWVTAIPRDLAIVNEVEDILCAAFKHSDNINADLWMRISNALDKIHEITDRKSRGTKGNVDEVLPTDPAESRAAKTSEHFKRFLTVPGTGIEFKRFFSPKMVRLVGAFRSPFGDRNADHVYEIEVKPYKELWTATGPIDGRLIFLHMCKSRWWAEMGALSAFKGRLRKSLRKTIDSGKCK